MAKDFDLTSPKWLELIFEKRNQQYGAYEIRNESSDRHLKSLLIVTTLCLSAIFLPKLIKGVLPSGPVAEETTAVNMTNFTEQDVPEEAKMEMELPPPPPLLKATQQFTEAVIAKDEEVRQEDQMLAQEDLSKLETEISVKTVEGVKEGGVNIADLENQKVVVEATKEAIYQHVEQMPQFPGGDKELMKWLSDNLEYPVIAQENGVQGVVTVRFVVKPDGSVSDVQVVKSLDASCDKEATRVIKKMPKWIPGKQNGTAVSVYYNLPVRFRLQDAR
ncbi:MAG: energy transducer TonB [Dysgonamonadaceae bacterium]|jgi:protein TonB|nr:energy transducer TonB [Dysgonamonadaceae bacterium]